MVDSDGVLGDASLTHIFRGDLRDPKVSDQPLVGPHDKEADERANVKYFRKPKSAAELYADQAAYAAERIAEFQKVAERDAESMEMMASHCTCGAPEKVAPGIGPYCTRTGVDAKCPDPYEPKILLQAKPKAIQDYEKEWAAKSGKTPSYIPQDLADARPKLVRETDLRGPKFSTQFEHDLYYVYEDARDLCLRKHRDYGPKNISQSPGGPLNGLRVRMWDKIARINHLIDNGAKPANESLRDSFVDLLNYSAIAIMCIQGDWPND